MAENLVIGGTTYNNVDYVSFLKTDGGEVNYYQGLTEQDKNEIVQMAKAELSQIEAPKIVSSVSEMTDTTKHYILQSSGTIWVNRSIINTSPSNKEPNFTNLANPNSSQWLDGYRISQSGGAPDYKGSAAGYTIMNVIGPVNVGDVVRIKGMNFGTNDAKVCTVTSADNLTPTGNGVGSFHTGTNPNVTNLSLTEDGVTFTHNKSDFFYWRFSGQLTGTAKDVIITINEEITYTEVPGETITTQEWVDTGISYAPTFKTDLIGVIGENNVIYLSDNALPSGTYTLKYGDETYETVGTITV